MCGLSGYISNTLNEEQRRRLVVGLGAGIDNRGGHAAGYISINDHTIKYCRKLGRWLKAKQKFLTSAAEGKTCMMHARLATCGNKEDVEQAHPFIVKRNDKVILWGAHNGMIHGAYESAKNHKRNIDVDSQEIFELLADKEYEAIRKLNGYGVITWLDANNRDHINVVKLTESGDICIVKTKEGGMVWGSTWYIVSEALKLAGLTADEEFNKLEVGRVYHIKNNGLYKSELDGIKLDNMYGKRSTYMNDSWSYYDHDDDGAPANHSMNCQCTQCSKYKTSSKHNTSTTSYSSPTSTSPSSEYPSGYKGFGYIPQNNGKLNRPNGDEEWWYNKKLHREDGPAVIRNNGDKEWYRNGVHHREDGPASERANGDFTYYWNGKMHRLDGPAVRFASKTQDAPPWEGYYIENEYCRNQELFEAAKKKFLEKQQENASQEKDNQPSNENSDAEKDIAMAKDHAFFRELKLFWKRQTEQEETNDWGEPENSEKTTQSLR